MGENRIVLQTKLGQLRGQTRTSLLTKKTYYAFQGIPYAKPPLEELRFKAPEPFGVWEGIRDALEDGNDPKQPSLIPKPGADPTAVTEGDEDCLYLNIYMNELPDKNRSRSPVMFSIHGGGFFGGNGSRKTSGPDSLLEEDVIVVTINYRCGAFGFLSLESDEVPGNAGLKDQTLALKWVQDNIDSFGGDPNNVTIFGISAGGASVHYHLLSPSSNGLFHKAITQSGSSFNPWAMQQSPRRVATVLAKTLGCTSENTAEILKFLRTISADDIVKATKEISQNEEFAKSLGMIFTPCVEVAGEDPFLADTPENIMKKGNFNRVPVIIGGVMNEGSVASFFGKKLNEKLFENFNKNPELIVPLFLGLAPGSREEKEAGKAIWNFYFQGKPLSHDNVDQYLEYQSDFLFNIGIEKTRTELVEKSFSPVFSYLFTNHSMCICSYLKSMFPDDTKFSEMYITDESCHGADSKLLYVYNLMPELVSSVSDEEKEAIRKYIKAWTTFASSGDPSCKEIGGTWEKDSLNKPCFMEIGTTWAMRKGIPFAKRIDFWKTLKSKYSTA